MEANLESDPPLITATLINGVVNDLLYQSDFALPHYPEWVDLAVVATGLGTLRSGIGFVKKTGVFWDSTQWAAAPRPFLDIPSLAYANAMAAWSRGDMSPSWANGVNGEIKRPMKASLKYLAKTNDSYFQVTSASQATTDKSQSDWWKLAAGDAAGTSVSTTVIAIRHLESDGTLAADQESLLLKCLRSNNQAIIVNAIAAIERMKVNSDTIVGELRSLVNDRDDQVRAKSLCVLTTLDALDVSSIDSAADMLESHFKHLVFAGVYALSTLDSVPEHIVRPVERAFMRALKSCDYEFVGLFAAAYNRWFENPQAEVESFLQDDGPEFLPVAMDALQGTPEQLVSL